MENNYSDVVSGKQECKLLSKIQFLNTRCWMGWKLFVNEKGKTSLMMAVSISPLNAVALLKASDVMRFGFECVGVRNYKSNYFLELFLAGYLKGSRLRNPHCIDLKELCGIKDR
jgi:hypothetical protein